MTYIHPSRRSSGVSGDDGFSLVELAIGLVVIGILIVPFMMSHNIEVVKSKRADTRRSLARSETAINHYFYNVSASYPCPASLILKDGDADFGKAGDCSNLAAIPSCATAGWRTNEGYCKTSNVASTAVIIGAVPFDTLGIDFRDTLDAWQNKLIYAVTFEQTSTTTYLSNSGALHLWAFKDTDGDPTTPPVSVDITTDLTNPPDFILVSTGETAVGGYTAEGVQTRACGSDTTQGHDNENCDFDNAFFSDVNPNDTALGSASDVQGPDFYDDITRVELDVPQSIWFPHPANAASGTSFITTMSNAVGIGTDTPTETLDVAGDIHVDGKLKSDEICKDGGDCMDPRFITEGTKCTISDAGGITRLRYSRFDCASAVDQNGHPYSGSGFSLPSNIFHRTECPTGRLQQGIDASGEPKCIIP